MENTNKGLTVEQEKAFEEAWEEKKHNAQVYSQEGGLHEVVKIEEARAIVQAVLAVSSIPLTEESETIDEALAIIQSALMNLSLDEPDVTMAKKNLVKINNLIKSLGGME